MTRRIVVIGAGVVGTLVARELASDAATQVVVVERAPESVLPGSTGHAPGFVGLYHEDEVHVPLAVRSAQMYDAFPSAFRRVGAFDVAESDEGVEQLVRRAEAARACGLDVVAVPVADAAAAAPAIVDPARVVYALRGSGDGAADASALTQAARADARSRGARFVFGAEVRGVQGRGSRLVVKTERETFAADDVVLAAGVWSGALAELADAEQVIVPVGHPYIYSPPQRLQQGGPLVRFRERAIYARVHGDRLGMGCYAHEVVDESAVVVRERAEGEWPTALFEPVVAREIDALPAQSRFVPDVRVNGVFAMTPDGRPYIGPVAGVPGLWTAQAIWITHAGGAARLLADQMRGAAEVNAAFAPDRFARQDPAELRRRALALY